TVSSTHPFILTIVSTTRNAALHSFPTRRSSDLTCSPSTAIRPTAPSTWSSATTPAPRRARKTGSSADPSSRAATPEPRGKPTGRSEEHTSELQSLRHLVCRLLLEKKKETRLVS